MEKGKFTSSDKLVNEFLDRAREFQTNIELLRVLKTRTYKIAESNVLIRAATEANRRYFFGLNYISAEEIFNIDNPFIAFICGSIERVVIIPAKLLFKYLPNISHDKNGEYKIVIDRDLNIVLSGRNNRLDCQTFINNWNLLLNPPKIKEKLKNTVEESLHTIIQGRLLEIGNIRGYSTYCPDKSKKFNDIPLKEISTLKTCPELQYSNYKLLRQIDVLWFKTRGSNLIPSYAFEIELTTGIWSGVGRMATLYDYSDASLYVISNDEKKYKQVISTFSEISNRFRYLHNDLLGDLYAAEIHLKELRFEIGL